MTAETGTPPLETAVSGCVSLDDKETVKLERTAAIRKTLLCSRKRLGFILFDRHGEVVEMRVESVGGRVPNVTLR